MPRTRNTKGVLIDLFILTPPVLPKADRLELQEPQLHPVVSWSGTIFWISAVDLKVKLR